MIKRIGRHHPLKTNGKKRSDLWPAFRRKNIAKNCVVCGTDKHLELHHIVPFHKHPEDELKKSNTVTVCETPGRNCHCEIAHAGNFKGWNPQIRKHAKMLMAERLKNKKRIQSKS